MLRWPVMLGGGLYVGYLIAANVALNTGLLTRTVNGVQGDLVVALDSGWTLWPSRVHLGGFALRFEDVNVQLSVTAQRLTADVVWSDAFRRRIHVAHVRGEGMRFRFRSKFERIEGSEQRAAAFPIIAGYDPVPELKPWPVSTTPPEKLWTVRVDDVNAELDEIWMLEAHFKGRAHAFGSFEFAPYRHLWVKNGEADFEGGNLFFGETDEVASSFVGKVRGDYSEHEPRSLTLKQNLARMTWVIDLLADITQVAFAESYFDSGLRFSGGKGPLKISLRTHDEQLLDNSSVSYTTPSLKLQSPAFEAGLSGSLAFEVRGVLPRVALELDRASVRLLEQRDRSITFDGAHGRMDFAHARLDQNPQPHAIDVRLDSVSTGSDDFKLSSGLRLGGKARAHLTGQADHKGRLAGTISTELLSARIRAGKHALRSITGKAHARVLTGQGWLTSGDLLEARLDLTKVLAQSGSAPGTQWWLAVSSPRVTYTGMPPSELDTLLTIRAKDGRPLLAALEQEKAMPGIVGVLWSLDHLTGRVRIQKQLRSLDIDIQDVRSESLGGRGRWRREGKSDLGVFIVTYGPFGVGLELDDDGLGVFPLSGKQWFETRMRARFGSLRRPHDLDLPISPIVPITPITRLDRRLQRVVR